MEEKEAESTDLRRSCQGVSPSDEPCGYPTQCTARRARGGSAMPTPRMRSGIRACCRLEKRAARH